MLGMGLAWDKSPSPFMNSSKKAHLELDQYFKVKSCKQKKLLLVLVMVRKLKRKYLWAFRTVKIMYP